MLIGSNSSFNEYALSASLNGTTLAHHNDIKLQGMGTHVADLTRLVFYTVLDFTFDFKFYLLPI